MTQFLTGCIWPAQKPLVLAARTRNRGGALPGGWPVATWPEAASGGARRLGTGSTERWDGGENILGRRRGASSPETALHEGVAWPTAIARWSGEGTRSTGRGGAGRRRGA
jgi:hypothetical protein